ncbi:MAG: IS630 family transposase [Verrucomicrobia bacterium]|jgi:transposase|nr:IS630 family transposase [Verrucomicrobiota bacterium]
MFRPAVALTISCEDKERLQQLIRAGKTPQRVALRARIVLAAAEGRPNSTIAKALKITRPTVLLWRARFQNFGLPGLLKDAKRPGRIRKATTEPIKNAIFALLHSPPSQHNINRTSWRLADIRQCLLAQGISVSRASISRIVRAAGYTWNMATEVLTSHDPEYQEKLERIKSVLSTLRENDRFCSIDEYGPFAVKMRGGMRLVGPGEHPHVPQFQKSKGSLIVTAALELSRNQVTHFYSKAKNTTEMIRLLEVLLEKYKGCDTLYLSWDAASWHASEALYKKVESINTPDLWSSAHAPHVELIPLPSSAQYLNVIESVFSGMAKAIIHNSDYQSVEEAMAPIDRHFLERNDYFEKNPKSVLVQRECLFRG